MCTVTFIPKTKTDFVLTSNRDESPLRTTNTPTFYKYQDVSILFPMDKVSEGSWIGISEVDRMVCLLNGGFQLHQRRESYRQSRGVVVKDALVANNIEDFAANYHLKDIEPFTLVMVDWSSELQLLELVWDGEERHVQELSLQPHIWSSAILYTDEMKKMREDWFEEFKKQNTLDAKNLIEFHKNAGIGDANVDTVMDRGFVKTTSITQVEKNKEVLQMRFEELANSQVTTVPFEAVRV